MTAVLEPTARRGFLSIPAQPWIPGQYGHGAVPVIGAPDTAAAATPTPARAVSGLPGLLKTALDVLVALLLLVLLFPVLLTLALAVRADGGPAFFRQTRVGLDGREFTMVKFRSMVVPPGPAWPPCRARTRVPAHCSSCATIRGSPGSARRCASTPSTSCPSCSTS